MEWIRRLTGTDLYTAQTIGLPGQSQSSSSSVALCKASVPDIFRDSYDQQRPVQTTVVNQESPCLAASHQPVDILANSSALPLHSQADVRVYVPPNLEQQQSVGPATLSKKQQQAVAGTLAAQQTPGAHNIRAAVYGFTNLSSVVAIVFANKLVLYTHGFPFAATLTWLHTLFTTLGMAALAAVGVFEVKRVPLAKSLPVATVYVGFIVLNNLSIQLNTVGFYQISKIVITPVVVGIEWLYYNKPASLRVLASIAVLLTGITLATITDSQVARSPLGVLVACVNIFVTGLYQVWAGVKQQELGLNGLQLLHQVAPCAVVLLALLIPFLEPTGFSDPHPGTILGCTLTHAAAFWIVVSAVLGLVVTLSTFLFIGATSTLTYSVVGHLKTALIVAGGVMFFGDVMTLKKLGGLVIAMAGIIWYSQVKLTDAKQGKQ